MSTKIIAALMVAILVIGSIGAASAAWPPNVPPYENCYALVVGISEYEGEGIQGDAGARNSASKFYYTLRETWGIFNPHATLLTDSQATWSNLNYYFDTFFADAGPNDLAIVFWAGHSGLIYDVAPFDEPDDLDGLLYTYDRWRYTDDEFAEKISAIPAGTKVVILDGCRTGEFSRELDMPNVLSVMGARCIDSTESYRYYFWGYTYKLYMPFSYYFSNSGDTNGDGLITIEEAFAYAYPLTVAKAVENGRSQHPVIVDNVPGDVAYLDAWG